MASTIRRYTTEQARSGIYETFYQHWINTTTGWQSISGLTSEPKVFYENIIADAVDGEVFTPDTANPALRVLVRHNTSEMDSFGEDGEGSFEATGIVTVQVFVPLDKNGLLFHDRLVKVAQRAFRGQTGFGDNCGIVFRRARINELGPQERWFVTNVLADFEYDEEV